MPIEKEGKETNKEAFTDNLSLYNKVRAVPEDAQKRITGGRLNGFTDINPMWRIKTLTEQFGLCGVGWKAPIRKFWLETGVDGVVSAFCEIELYIKVDGAWSEGISGVGGAAFVSKEKGGLYTSDECYKMAYTDAIGVACKMLGIGADIYWTIDGSKYRSQQQEEKEKEDEQAQKALDGAIDEITDIAKSLINAGNSKDVLYEIIATLNDGSKNPANIKSLEICNAIKTEFAKLAESSTSENSKTTTTKNKIKSEDNN